MNETSIKKRDLESPTIIFIQKTADGSVKVTSPKKKEYILTSKNAYKILSEIANDPEMPAYSMNPKEDEEFDLQSMAKGVLKEYGPSIMGDILSKFRKWKEKAITWE